MRAGAMGGPCCRGMEPPKGPEWEPAAAGWEPLLEEALTICDKHNGCCPSVHNMKTSLDQEWTAKANEYLNKHSLQVEVHGFYTYNGQSSQPHLVLQIKKQPPL